MEALSLTKIEQSLRKAGAEEQRRFLSRLPRLLLSIDTFSSLKNAEPSFEFWNNPADAVYDGL